MIFEWQDPSTGWFGQNMWVSGVSKIFLTKKGAPKIFFTEEYAKFGHFFTVGKKNFGHYF